MRRVTPIGTMRRVVTTAEYEMTPRQYERRVIGDNVRRARQAMPGNVTQVDVAEAMVAADPKGRAWDARDVSHYETARRKPERDHIELLGKVLGQAPDWFYVDRLGERADVDEDDAA